MQLVYFAYKTQQAYGQKEWLGTAKAALHKECIG